MPFQQGSRKKTFRCAHCSKIFTQNTNLLRHIRKIHLQDVHSLCKKCGRSFVNKSARDHHMQMDHSTVKCEKCKNHFAWSEINKHMDNCIKNALLICVKCRFVFTTQIKLDEHNCYNHACI